MTFPRALSRYARGTINNMTLHLAGHAAFADLEHVGRKSGIVHHTPVRAFRAGDTVIIGLNFGRQSDWYQNIYGSRNLPHPPGRRATHPRRSGPRACRAGRQGHSVAVQIRAQARGPNSRMRPAAHLACISRHGHRL
jgi:F420H(2)-dependent quinone reductase